MIRLSQQVIHGIYSVLYSLRPASRATDHGPIGPISLKTAHRAVFRALDASGREAFGAVIRPKGSLPEGAGWHGSFALSKAGLAFSQTANGSILGIEPWHRSQTEGVPRNPTTIREAPKQSHPFPDDGVPGRDGATKGRSRVRLFHDHQHRVIRIIGIGADGSLRHIPMP